MKKTILKITALSLFAAALVAAPVTARAAETTNTPAAAGQEAPVKHKKHGVVPFNGKLTAVDKAAMTLTVGERTFEITSETKITKDGQPATLADAVVGETVGGSYKKNTDGKLSATSVRFGKKKSEGEKPEGATKKKKKAAAESAETSTNSVAK